MHVYCAYALPCKCVLNKRPPLKCALPLVLLALTTQPQREAAAPGAFCRPGAQQSVRRRQRHAGLRAQSRERKPGDGDESPIQAEGITQVPHTCEECLRETGKHMEISRIPTSPGSTKQNWKWVLLLLIHLGFLMRFGLKKNQRKHSSCLGLCCLPPAVSGRRGRTDFMSLLEALCLHPGIYIYIYMTKVLA